jgi:hypothetical protein
VDAQPLGWGRIALGTLFLLRTTPVLAPLGLDFTMHTFPLLGWPGADWQGDAIGLGLPAWAVGALCVVRTVAALCFLVGVRTTASGLCAGVSGYLVMIQDPFGFVATLHLLYQGTIVLALTDAASVLALRPERPRNVASSMLLVRAFLASIYFWAALVKLRPDWLDGRTLALFQADGALDGPLAALVLATPWSRSLVAWTIALTELTLPVLLFWRKTKRFAPFVALGMHAMIELSANPDLLGWEMAALLLCLWPEPPAETKRRGR